MKKYLSLKSVKVDKKLSAFLTATKEEFDNFYDFKATEPLLFFVPSRQDLDLIMGKKTEKWFVGVTKNNAIFILDKNIYAKESNHKAKNFWLTLKHEYSHIYYSQMTNSHYPCWLNEGLACYLSGKKLILSKDYNSALDVFNYFDKSGSNVYMIGQFWVEFLIKKFGKKKLVRLIKSLNFEARISERRFASEFYKIYDFRFDKKSFTKKLGKNKNLI
ncbi:MAG: hypothetical protein WC465_04520 [Patescibacteria group bacterium]